MLQVPSSDAVPPSLWTADYGSEDGIPCKMLILSEFLKYAQFDIEGNHSCFAGLHARSLPPASPCLLQLPTPPSRLPSPTYQVDWNSLQPGQKLMIKLSLDTIFGDAIQCDVPFFSRRGKEYEEIIVPELEDIVAPVAQVPAQIPTESLFQQTPTVPRVYRHSPCECE